MAAASPQEMREHLCDQLVALEKIWREFTHQCELEAAELKLDRWVAETEELLSNSGKSKALQSVSRLVSETVQDRESLFFERVKKYRMFISMLIKELNENME